MKGKATSSSQNSGEASLVRRDVTLLQLWSVETTRIQLQVGGSSGGGGGGVVAEEEEKEEEEEEEEEEEMASFIPSRVSSVGGSEPPRWAFLRAAAEWWSYSEQLLKALMQPRGSGEAREWRCEDVRK
ncbi:hypothetical protein E2C01_062596 [Portunus trituberculatus]|uniref:Uncharacterized protein n=1 Tax=Portunus trituberculatus TaxID=210409 RepID=A0A5B7HEG3_PORTR|nr:hypothetical protein [Portunus trituberculatus]